MIGKLLDHRYQVTRILATGGFGQTYIAQDTRRPGNPICVVKHLKPASSDPKVFATAKRLFQSEAETLENLGNHDQIPRLLAYFDENQEFFLVQEYVDGHTLAEELIPGQRWSEGQVMQLLIEVLGILEFVHQQGVIHRDIKPDNIIRRGSDYKLVLVDFGAVKQLRSPLVTVGTQTTATVAIGTPGYMPTEQGQGKPRPNSDIYALGIIAIQALTGVPASQLQEDADTGEILWQHLAPIDSRLAAVLTKMVRYHFKERYQTATEALQACRALINITPDSSLPPAPVKEVKYQPQPVQPKSQVFVQKTMAVSPGNRDMTKTTGRDNSKPDPLPLLIGIFLVGGVAALMTNFYPNIKSFTTNWTGNNKLGKTCLATVEPNSNIRSEPSSINSDNIVRTIGEESSFEGTGKRTKRGWVEIKINPKKSAWVNSQVISNYDQWLACLRDKGISSKIVDDSSLIATRPIPKPQTKPSNNPSNNPFIFPPQTIDKATPELDQSELNQQKDKIIQQARQKFESGDLQGAIATLRSIPGNATSTIQETGKIIQQWQDDWKKAEELVQDINQAIDNGQWEKVLAYRDHPEKLPDIKYWRDKLEPLFQQAAENVAKQAVPKTPTATPTPN
ncbi:MAG TPA: serine/threonine-protein kinase [Nostocaceae cyanobacterium]|nr:serine/threonine-protein kinase [Nostocaceae cyanobacterium]